MRLKNREQRQTEKTGLRFSSQTCLEYFLSCVTVFAAEKFSADCCQGVFRALRAQFKELFYKQNQHNYYKHNTEHMMPPDESFGNGVVLRVKDYLAQSRVT